ncbi:MAG TPA: hypothetical protein VFX35_00310 [Solirubrobacterales bacterium]|nr:hypothetical protein [Solirubrobacterales bacterium]
MVRVLLAAVVAALLLFGGAAQAADVPPSVAGESTSQITATDATLEASLESGSAPAYYQFQFSKFPTEFPDELSCPPPPSSGPFLPCIGPESSDALPIDKIAQADGATTVALDLADAGVTLAPGKTYYFRVVVAPAAPSEDTIEWEDPVVGGEEQSFTTLGASNPPSVTGEGASQVTATGATLEASLDSGGAPAYYQFQFSEFPTEFPDELSCPPPPVLGLPACVGPQSDAALPIGYVPSGDGHVALSLADAGITLKPGVTYFFRALVATAKQTEDSVEWERPVVGGELQAFTTPPELGEPPQQAGGAAAGAQAILPAPIVHRRHRHHRRHHGHRRALAAIALARIAH